MSHLLQTKLHAPRRRTGLVRRSRLTARLRQTPEAALTLVSGPAGFGKTTLLAEWLRKAPSDGLRGAWLSLDGRDNDPVVFWSYVIAALQQACPGVGDAAIALLQSSQPSTEAAIATLVNELEAMADHVVLVLDDYHVIEAPEVQDGMAFLLQHLPQHVHVVVAGRADPALPLARLRARGELVEIRAADLRFTRDETATYLSDVSGLNLSTEDVVALDGRTEGWIAALQLAVLSMQGRDDVSGFIAGFAGDDRHIVDFLVEEVLQRQTDEVRTFLLRTCVLDRLTGPLCDAVTGGRGGKTQLEALERQNLFVMPLDERRSWYRYHHLFADVLRTYLLDEQPDAVADLHVRASRWYEREGDRLEALRHAVAADDLERAAGLMELAMPALRRSRQEATIRTWEDMLPHELVRTRPVLNIGLLGARASGGDFRGLEDRLRDAEQWLDMSQRGAGGRDGPNPEEMVVVDTEELALLPGTIQMYRAAHALLQNDPAGTMQHARAALRLTPPGDHLPRAGAMALLGLAAWTTGNLGDAHQAYADSMSIMERAGFASDVLGCALALADLELAQGHLLAAQRTYERGVRHGTDHRGPALRGTADMHVGLSEVYRERNDLGEAKQHLQKSQDLGEHLGLPQNPYRWRVAMARLRQASGDLDGALELLVEAERVYTGDFSPNVRPIPALKARMLLAKGAIHEAAAWARSCNLTVDDDLSYLREYEHVTLARVLVAQRVTDDRADPLGGLFRFVDRLLSAAEHGGRAGSVIEIVLLRTLALQVRGNVPLAHASLERALSLAEPEGYVRLFLDEGPPMVSLLKGVAKQSGRTAYVHRLVAAADRGRSSPSHQGLVDPLSDRELEVLRLLGTDLDGPDIARELVISLNTVRTHTKHIYTKLGVNNRRAAVRQGRQLNLL